MEMGRRMKAEREKLGYKKIMREKKRDGPVINEAGRRKAPSLLYYTDSCFSVQHKHAYIYSVNLSNGRSLPLF